MTIEQLISPIVPTLLPTDTGNRALYLMEENNFQQLPLIIDERYKALIQENDVLDWEAPGSPLSIAHFLDYKPAVFAHSHPFDAMRIAHAQNLSVVPVIDNENKYLGAITSSELLKYITENSGLDMPGGIIVLEISPRNYTLHEIARICENEDVLLTSTQLRTNSHNGMLEVTLKTNRTDIDAVIASLERHNYKVIEAHGEQAEDEDVQDRFNNLMNFINI
ncbi:MAG: CBS domain-containing protein [Flavipsychrobacter sp.]|nr:CBS domain-containing protein [Flavipsychrobacter sp.]